MESLRKGLSGMDAARAAMGQGWPFAACPWSNDGAREPDAVGPDARGKTFWLLLGQLPKVTRRKGGTVRPGWRLSQWLGTGLRGKFRLMSSFDDCAGMTHDYQAQFHANARNNNFKWWHSLRPNTFFKGTTELTANNVFEEIENWKLEAKLEDNSRYFYHTRIIDQILSGKKLYVIGRKGTGKTAITENLISRTENEYFARKLTFKNFPFNKLYELEDKGFSNPNQYITLWKYVIYATTCKMLIDNKNVSFESREKLKEIFPDNIESALASAVERWTSTGFNLNILGNGGGFNQGKTLQPTTQDWIAKVEILENFLQGELGAEKYIIVFDELDEDYKEIIEPTKYTRYTNLLTSLFKAAQDIRARFPKHKYYPVICLRDDIYDLLQDPDKTKWTDLKSELEWNEDSLKRMLAFRISRALDPSGEILNFNEAWEKIISSDAVKTGHRKKIKNGRL